MAEFAESDFKLRDNKTIHLYTWNNIKNPKGVIQIVHGSCEHSLRYHEFANFLNKQNFIVISIDLRGHGKSVKNGEEFGLFAKDEGWKIIVDDLFEVNNYIKKKYDHLPIIMIGHSMGSFLVRNYIIDYPGTLAAAVLTGTGYYFIPNLLFGKFVAQFHQKIHGLKYHDKFIYNLSFKPLNKKFNNKGANGVEWLTNDSEAQKEYLTDPLIFRVFTASGYKDMFNGLLYIQKKNNIKQTSANLPILFLSGKDDPVGKYGKKVTKIFKIYKKFRLNVSIKLYDSMRHEILNEINRTKVYQDISKFIDNQI